MRAIRTILFLLVLSFPGLGQVSLLQEGSYLIDNQQTTKAFALKDTLRFKKTNGQLILPKFSTLRFKFRIQGETDKHTKAYIYCNSQGLVKLFRITQSGMELLGKTGFTCPYHERSLRDEISFIQVDIPKDELHGYILEIKNYAIEHDALTLLKYDYSQYQEIKINQSNSFISKYAQPIFLGVVVLILIITAIQLFLFRERIYFIYLLYIVFILLRVAMSISLLVIEDIFVGLREVGFISRFSQTFSFLSIICYLFFIREFADIPKRWPLFDKFIQFQILFMALYMMGELFFVVEKYTVPLYISVHNGFEFVEMILSMVTLLGLLRLYNQQNKFLVWGVCTLFLGAFVGQQILLRLSTLSRLEQDEYLQLLWGISYLGEMAFFTTGLFHRTALMKQTLESQHNEHQKLLEELNKHKEKEVPLQPDKLSIATNKGTIVIRQENIIRVEAAGNYTIFYVQNQPQVMASSTMAEFEEKLDVSKFIRVHKSHIINCSLVTKYKRGDGGSLTLQDGSEIPVSRSRKEELLRKLQIV
ncbi:LytTR family transcriptional regulator DNA-binding domain-containing protein [Emticicia sp. BO119]|uniref:LytTR family transcriptional regulator DNA-binding domain-containing protein n=1 Tax=Emticicia sp. BO119 TaxID=2757768 RepID=UPI0015F0BCC9|nr:LytTR family transcriptional regulator DNA-binding domain-containing protein [Emticicia sp. BO119]MBA4851210.1 LytTR family transcriptional regulator DNA-binding domain-containing protein [Emticicia sp. BO119]